MGLGNNSSNVKYVRIKDGKLYLNSDLETSFDELSGLLTRMSFKDDTYKDQTIRKCNIGLTDAEDGTTYVLGLSVDSSYFSSLVSFLKNANLAEPITLHPKINKYKKDDGSDGERRSILVSQDGHFLKSFYSKDSGNKLPEFKKVMVNKKPVYDKGDFLEELERIVTEEFIPKLPKQPVVSFTETAKKPAAKTETSEAVDEKLPWEE